MKKLVSSAVFLLTIYSIANAGITLTFDAGPDNNSGVADELAKQFSIQFESNGSDLIYATFNFAEGDYDASITEIVFEDSSNLFDTAEFISEQSSAGVSYFTTDNPSAPQWQSYYSENFAKDVTDFYAFDIKEDKSTLDSNSKGKKFKGLNSGQHFTIAFRPFNGISYDSLKSKIKIGFHAQSIKSINDDLKDKDPSDAFFNPCTPSPPIVPAPGAILLTSFGTALVARVRRQLS